MLFRPLFRIPRDLYSFIFTCSCIVFCFFGAKVFVALLVVATHERDDTAMATVVHGVECFNCCLVHVEVWVVVAGVVVTTIVGNTQAGEQDFCRAGHRDRLGHI